MITLVLVAAALAVVFWPQGKSPSLPAASELFRVPPLAPAGDSPSINGISVAQKTPAAREAIDSLLAVRDRLAANGSLSAESAKAVDQLWLDLLHGSNPK